MNQITSLWGAQELASRLGTTRRSVNTLRWKIAKGLARADRLPPALAIGGRPRWDPDQVEAWLLANRRDLPSTQSTISHSKAGRPRNKKVPPIRLY